MPFWWNRRRKPWYGRWRYRRRLQRYKRRKPRRRFTRRRGRKTTRRRRRRKYKVRRKQKKITIKQWQPESITKCKIKGYSTLVLGAEGTQYLCWTNQASDYTQPKAPGGGGFGCELITLEWLYKEYRAHNNIWTRSNQNKDLCRYTGCTITLYRHPTVDFIFAYSIMPPFNINKFTYTDIQPQNMLLRAHHKVILSRMSHPRGKLRVKVHIKPPKQMSTRWYFQKEFADAGLVLLQASACDFGHPRISPLSQSQMITIYYLNTTFWPTPDWGQAINQPWKNILTQDPHITFHFKNSKGQTETYNFGQAYDTWEHSISGYYQSINRSGGWFDPRVLNAFKVTKTSTGAELGALPLYTARYNPNEDTGENNEVYVISILQHSYQPPTVTPDYIIRGQPLWMALFGFYSFLKYSSKDKGFMEHYMFVLKSPAIKPISQVSKQNYYPFLDPAFIAGKLPFDEYLSDNIAKLWYPTAERQIQTINALVESGPFIPRLTNIKYSTWELSYNYKFFFKWGGPQVTDQNVDDPKYQQTYPTPGNQPEAVQIADPRKMSPESLLHEWDFRRGIVTQAALKRMQENLTIDTDFQSDDSESPPKRRKITKEMPCKEKEESQLHHCLQQLCKEDTFQEAPQTLQELINQQQQQQQHLKHNILQLLTELKKKQRFLSLQTGLLE
nr:MAG: ORF1 [Torque teno midi virus]